MAGYFHFFFFRKKAALKSILCEYFKTKPFKIINFGDKDAPAIGFQAKSSTEDSKAKERV